MTFGKFGKIRHSELDSESKNRKILNDKIKNGKKNLLRSDK